MTTDKQFNVHIESDHPMSNSKFIAALEHIVTTLRLSSDLGGPEHVPSMAFGLPVKEVQDRVDNIHNQYQLNAAHKLDRINGMSKTFPAGNTPFDLARKAIDGYNGTLEERIKINDYYTQLCALVASEGI